MSKDQNEPKKSPKMPKSPKWQKMPKPPRRHVAKPGEAGRSIVTSDKYEELAAFLLLIDFHDPHTEVRILINQL